MSTTPAPEHPVVVVLTGGASRRMGTHKPTLDVAGRPLVARVLDAAGTHPALVVGPGQGVPDGVPVVMERVPGGGPVSALAYAVAAVREGAARVPGPDAESSAQPSAEPSAEPDAFVVLAADLPFVTPAHVDRLVEALAAGDLAVTVDPDGRTNWLCAAWRATALTARLAEVGEVGDAYGRSMRELGDGIRTVRVDDPDDVAADVDTPAQLERARARAQRPAD